MSIETITEQIKEIIETVADIEKDEISVESLMIDDLDLSSIEIMSIVSDVERRFSVKISESEMLEITTVGELADIVNKKI